MSKKSKIKNQISKLWKPPAAAGISTKLLRFETCPSMPDYYVLYKDEIKPSQINFNIKKVKAMAGGPPLAEKVKRQKLKFK